MYSLNNKPGRYDKQTPVKLLLLLLLMVSASVGLSQNINTPNKPGPLGTQVNTYNGNLYIPRMDVLIPGRGFDISATFYYNSFLFGTNKGYGNGWDFIYDISYRPDTVNNKIIVWGDGREDYYTALSGGAFQSPVGFFNTLSEYQPGKYVLTELNGTKFYFDNSTYGKITKMTEPNGNAINFNYTDSLLTSLVNSAGQSLTFTYNANGRLATMVDAITSPTRTWTYTYDGNGNLVTVTDPLNATDKYAYLVNGPMKSLSDKNSNTVDIIYYPDFSLSELIGCNKRQSYSYDTLGKVTVATDYVPTGTNQVIKYGYKKQGERIWLTSLTSNCCGYNMVFEFDDAGNKVKETDGNGNAVAYTYDNKGNVLTIKDALGQTMSYTYSSDFNNITSVTDAKGQVTTMTYNSNGDIIQVNDPGNRVYTATYNANGDIATSTDPEGHVFTYNYDSYGNPTDIIGPDGYHAVFGSDARGNLVSYKDSKNNASSFEYDILSRVKRLTDPLGNTIKLVYDAAGNITTMTNQNNEVSHLKYDASNRMVEFSNAMNNKTTMEYDAMDNPVAVKNALNNRTSYTYDSRNRINAVKDALGNTSTFSYDATDNLVAVSLPNGQQINFTYDVLDRITTMADATSTIVSVEYDKNSNITKVTNGTGAVTTAAYDNLDRINKITDPLGNMVAVAYDKNNNVTSVTDRNGFVRSFTYDGMDRVKTYTDNTGGVVTITYDAVGNPVSMKDQNNNITNNTFDEWNRIKRITYPDGRFIEYTYDSKENVTAKKLTDGSTITYAYDSLNRVKSKTLPGGQVFTYTYDALNRVTSATNNAGTVSFTYDALDRLLSETFDGRTTTYTYDVAGRRQTTVYPDGTTIYRTFDMRNRLTSIAKGSTILATYEYNNVNQVITKTFGNGITTHLQYDFANRLSNFSTGSGSIQNTAYTYDKQQNKNSVSRLDNPSLSEEFTYDHKYRITGYKRGVIGGSPTVQNSYTYDAAGNRTAATLNGANVNYTINNLNQLTATSGAQNVTLTYDNNGNITYDGKYYKQYDAESRLLKDSVSPGNVITYLYDAFGRRVQKTVNGIPVKYSYSGMAQIEERDGVTNDLLTRTVLNGFISPVINEKNGSVYYYHQNEMNSVEAITNSNGTLAERYQYDVYGKQTIYDASGNILPNSSTGNRYGFTGQEFDSAGNGNRFFFRNYNTDLGIFNQRDLIGYADGTAMYQYVHDNPANGIDIFGLQDCPPTELTFINKREKEVAMINAITSTIDLILNDKTNAFKKNLKELEYFQKHLETLEKVLVNQKMMKEANNVADTWVKTTESLEGLQASKFSKFSKGMGKVGFGLNVADATIKTIKLGSTINDYMHGNADGADVTMASGNLAQSALGFTPLGAAYNLADFAQEKFLTGHSMNENAAIVGDVYGSTGVDQDQEEREADFHRQKGDFQKWWKLRRKQMLEDALRKRGPRPNCPQNGPTGGTLKPPPGPLGPIIAAIMEILHSLDPNEIIGPDGEPNKRWVSVKDRLPYTILYENSTAASAPAKFVRITAPVQPKQDAATFELGTFGFNNQTFIMPANTASYYQRLDCRDSLGLYVDVTAGYDQLHNEAFWEFQSIDPVTLLPPADPLKGFLLLQDTSKITYGHGFVNFSIKPRQTAVTLDTIGARADIVFDSNDTIPTNIAKNTIDAFAPTSHMNALPATSSSPVSLSWGGADDVNGCGLKYYTLYTSTDGVNFNIVRSGITRTDTTITAAVNTTYYFFVLATDTVGNTEVLRPGEIRSTFIGSVLPISWLYFKGVTKDKDNILDWATASEQNSKDFKVERSLNGSSFTQIGTVAAAGNSSIATKYEYKDLNIDKLNAPVMFYRLKQTDINGNFKYSNIVRLTYDQKTVINSIVYPNPTEGVVTITVGDRALIGTEAGLYDENGRLLEIIKITANSQSVDISKYVNGIYFVRLSNKEVLKIVKL